MAIIIQGINSPVGTGSSEIIGAALKKAGREDLIGYGKECLIRPNRSGEQNVAPRSSKPAHRHGVSAARPEKPRRSVFVPLYPCRQLC